MSVEVQSRVIVGLALRALRVEKDILQVDIARKLDRHQSWVSDVEHGRRPLEVLVAKRWLEALGADVTLDQLTERAQQLAA